MVPNLAHIAKNPFSKKCANFLTTFLCENVAKIAINWTDTCHFLCKTSGNPGSRQQMSVLSKGILGYLDSEHKVWVHQAPCARGWFPCGARLPTVFEIRCYMIKVLPRSGILQTRDVVQTKKVWECIQKIAILKQLKTHFKPKRLKRCANTVPTRSHAFPCVPAPLHPCFKRYTSQETKDVMQP